MIGAFHHARLKAAQRKLATELGVEIAPALADGSVEVNATATEPPKVQATEEEIKSALQERQKQHHGRR